MNMIKRAAMQFMIQVLRILFPSGVQPSYYDYTFDDKNSKFVCG